MKIKTSEIINALAVLEKLYQKDTDYITAVNISTNKGFVENIKAFSKIKVELEDFRNELIGRYAKKNEAGQPIVNANNQYEIEDTNAYNDEIKDAFDKERDLEVEPIDVALISAIGISANDIAAINFLIKKSDDSYKEKYEKIMKLVEEKL